MAAPAPANVTAEIEIDAPPTTVYAALVDFPKWSEWNPFIVEAAGTATVGDTLQLRFNDGMRFAPVVEAAEPGKELRWLGKLDRFGLLFNGQHRFELSEPRPGVTRVRQSETFTGLLARPLLFVSGGKITKNFESLNEGLKRRAEQLQQ